MIMGEQNGCESGTIVLGTGVGMAFGSSASTCITTPNACQWPTGASEDRGPERSVQHRATVTALFLCQAS